MQSLVTRVLPLLLAAPLAAQDGAEPAAPAKPDAQKAEKAVKLERLKVGDSIAADVSLTDLDGKPFAFADARGKPVVVHFWSIVCPYEKAAEPKMLAIAKDYPDAVVLAVNANQNEIGDAPDKAAFAAEKDGDKPYPKIRKHASGAGFNHRILLDHDAKLAHLLGGKTTPHCFVFDGKGVLAYEGALDDDPMDEKGAEAKAYVRLALDAVKAGKEVEAKTTKPYG